MSRKWRNFGSAVSESHTVRGDLDENCFTLTRIGSKFWLRSFAQKACSGWQARAGCRAVCGGSEVPVDAPEAANREMEVSSGIAKE